MARKQILVIILILMATLMFRIIASQQCGVDSNDCRQACNSDVRCQSYNYVMFKDICELNNRTKEARPEDFVKNSDRYYMPKEPKFRVPLGSIPELPADSCREIKASEGGQAVSGNYWLDSTRSGNSILARCDMKTEIADYCIKHQCQNNATCVNGHVNYTCACNSSGWTGNYCEKDVDECTEDLHGCHSDATCQNTEGSYSCTCNSEYLGDGVSCEPKECQIYKALISGTRQTTYVSKKPKLCDDSIGPGWFRFQGAAGTKMPTECVTWNRCGTLRPGWLKGDHPTVAAGQVERKVNFRSNDNCSYQSTNIKVRNCGAYYVYYFHGIPSGGCCRYCGTG